MSIVNYIPLVAHLKALVHLAAKDKEAAKKTLETCHTKSPGFAHLQAAAAKMAGQDELAKKCWDGGNNSLGALPLVGHAKALGHYVMGEKEDGDKTVERANDSLLNIADHIPVVGHVKSGLHYVLGEKEESKKAFKAATRSSVVIAGGAALGMVVASPVGVVAGRVGAGAEWDLITARQTDGKEVNGVAKIINNPKDVDAYFGVGLSLFGDGMVDHSGQHNMAEIVVGLSEMGNENEDPAAAAQVDDSNEKLQNETISSQGVPVMSADQLGLYYENGFITERQYNLAMEEITKDQQPQSTENNKSVNSAGVVELRQWLAEILDDVDLCGLVIQNQETSKKWSRAEKQFQRESFRQIYAIVSQLISNGHSAAIVGPGGKSLVIYSRDGSWSVEIDYQVANYLKVHNQLIGQQFHLDKKSSCPTVLSAELQESRLALNNKVDHSATDVIYGIRCRICDHRFGQGNISYVGRTNRSVHDRVCNEHARSVAYSINDGPNLAKDAPYRPMYQHAAEHLDDLPSSTEPWEVFRLVMDVILLPTGSIIDDDDLESWECFWQFFFQCRQFFWDRDCHINND